MCLVPIGTHKSFCNLSGNTVCKQSGKTPYAATIKPLQKFRGPRFQNPPTHRSLSHTFLFQHPVNRRVQKAAVALHVTTAGIRLALRPKQPAFPVRVAADDFRVL